MNEVVAYKNSDGIYSDINSEGSSPIKKLSEDAIKVMVEGILSDWKIQCDMKKITRTIKVRYENQKIYLYQSNFETIYNIDERTITGHINNVSEDLRDYLRRRGIKIYTDRFFKSI